MIGARFLPRILFRQFSTAAPLAAEPGPINHRAVFLKVGAVVGAGVAGSLVYDYVSRRNFSQLTESIRSDLVWDDEWDRYVRVPPVLQEEIKSWFVKPDMTVVADREAFDEANDIGVRSVIMVRHGQYTVDEAGHLTELGKQQAVLTGKRLKELLAGKSVRCIYHSNMNRAKETAQLISQSLPGVELRESALLAEAIPAPPNPPMDSCPPFEQEAGVRLESAFRTFFARPMGDGTNESVDIIVGHGNCFRFFVCRAMQIDPTFWLRMAIYNCGLTWIELGSSGHVSVRAVGDVGHIPAKDISYS